MEENNKFINKKLETLAEILDVKLEGNERTDLENIYNKARKRVKLIFIAEAPKKMDTYFYNLNGSQNGLTSNLIKPLERWVKGYEKNNEKQNMVKFFLDYGYWLTDLFYNPIKDIDENNEKEIKLQKDKLKKEIISLKPEKIVFILPKKGFGDTNWKNKKYRKYFSEINFIEIQKMILENLRDELKLNYKFKIAPHPVNGVSEEWKEKRVKERGVKSFSDWVSNYKENGEEENGDIIKEWLEIDGE